MKRSFSPTLFLVLLGIALMSGAFSPAAYAASVAAGGACPTPAQYLNPTTNTQVTLASMGVNSCFYIAANGSDSNAGTSEASPWLHAPGMGSCSGTCASVTPAAGEGFIFRGGDTWHASSGTPMICGSGPCQWTWNWSGSSSSPIYVGVDQSWYSGGSWARPVLSMDNPLTNSNPGSCTHDDSNISGVNVSNQNYVTFDNFEFSGKCWAGNVNNNSVAYFFRTGTNITIENAYFHGWTLAGTAFDGDAAISGSGGAGASKNVVASVVIDGSDSTLGTTSSACANAVNGAPCNSGWGIQGDCYDVHSSVIRYTSNAIECSNITYVHDNLIENTYATLDGMSNGVQGPHPNTLETDTGYSGQSFYLYNNVIIDNAANVTLWPQAATHYIFNNVIFNSTTSAPNCIMLSPVGNSGGSSAATAYVYNNTVDNQGNGCEVQFYGQSGNSTTAWVGGTAYFENNHFVGFGNPGTLSNTYTFGPAASGNISNGGGQVFQSESTANGQGYTASNDYAPTSDTDATVGAGTNASSFCSSMPYSAASTACQSGLAGVSYNTSSHSAVANQAAARTASAWDAGAYQFGNTSAVAAPTGLSAVVQ